MTFSHGGDGALLYNSILRSEGKSIVRLNPAAEYKAGELRQAID